MPTRTIYIPDSEVATWDAATEVAARHKSSISKMIIGQLKLVIRDRQTVTGLPLGFAVPESMKDPKVVAREQLADRVRALVLDELADLDES